MDEARAAASRSVNLQRELVDLNEVIREMMLLLHSEATQFAVLVRTELGADLPQVMGDQQVLMNLMMNSIDAMKDLDGTRELSIQSQRGENGQVLISVSDTGRGSAATEGGAEAGLEAQGLAAAQAGGLDPFHQVEVLGQLEIFDPNLAVNNNLACSYCHDPAAGYGNGSSVLSVFTGGSNPGSASITVHGAFPNNRIAKRSPNS